MHALVLCAALCHQLQGKLEPDARQALIAKGQQLKQQLEELEAKLVQVGRLFAPLVVWDRHMCVMYVLVEGKQRAQAQEVDVRERYQSMNTLQHV
jgi:hypothetical protein